MISNPFLPEQILLYFRRLSSQKNGKVYWQSLRDFVGHFSKDFIFHEDVSSVEL
jgi:hypothetical protein